MCVAGFSLLRRVFLTGMLLRSSCAQSGVDGKHRAAFAFSLPSSPAADTADPAPYADTFSRARAQTFGTFTIQSSWAWRIPSILQGLPSAVQVGLIWFCPESPRWLVSKGRSAPARFLASRFAYG